MIQPNLEDVQSAVGDRYEVTEFFARGGMGAVFLGRHRALGSQVAIKVLPQPGGESADGFARFKREAALAANLSHPNIVPVFEFGVSHDVAYLVMPFVQGQSLADLLARDGALDYPAVLELVRQVGAGLAFAHARGVVHRDVKPHNILLERETGRWLLTDFGVARARVESTAERTATGAVVGTPAYMAPEQALGVSDVDGRADLYALAATACEALTGVRTNTLCDARAAEEALRNARPDLRREVARALTAPLAHDRDLRPKSIDDWIAHLQRASRRPRLARPVWLAAAGVAGALAILWALRQPDTAVGSEPTTLVLLPFAVTQDPPGFDLGPVVTRSFEEQLRWLPNYRIVSADRSAAVIQREFGADAPGPDSLARFVAVRLGASEMMWGTVSVGADSQVRIEVRLSRGSSEARPHAVVGSVDSLRPLVSEVALAVFADRLAGQTAGWSPAVPRGGIEVFRAYHDGERLFRRGAYSQAVERFDAVIRRDSTFAPAHFKRMLAEVLRSQPTRATTEIRSALEAARRYRSGLDPVARALLDGYTILLDAGDLVRAQEVFQEIVDRHPDAVDAWFVLGYLQYNFAPLLRIPRESAGWALTQAHRLDPEFAAVVAQLARLAADQHDEARARRYIAEFLAIDSTSVWAEVARMGDSLLYRGQSASIRVLQSFEQRSTAALELIGLASGELHQRHSERTFARLAVDALWERATTERERVVAFRMEMANALGFGRRATAESLLADVRRRGWIPEEHDRWLVLLDATGVPSLGNEEAAQAAATRLLDRDDEEGMAAWAAARWFRHTDRRQTRRAAARLTTLVGAGRPLAQSLAEDLAALDSLARGDTAAALRTWARATSRYSIEHVIFGLVGSLWPLRLEMARVLTASGDHDEVLAATAPFEQMAGFVDQVAWPEALVLRAGAHRALGQPDSARAVYGLLHGMLQDANGSGAALRDSVVAWLGQVEPVQGPPR